MKFDKIVIDKTATETGNTFVGRRVPLSSAELEEQGSLVGSTKRARQEGLDVRRHEKMHELGKELRDGLVLTGWNELAGKLAKRELKPGQEERPSSRGGSFYSFEECVESMTKAIDEGLNGHQGSWDRGEQQLKTSIDGYLIAEGVAELGVEELYKTFGDEFLPMIDASLKAAKDKITLLSTDLQKPNIADNIKKLIKESEDTVKILEKSRFKVLSIGSNPEKQKRLADEVAEENVVKIKAEKDMQEALRMARRREEEEKVGAIKRSLE